VLELGAGRFDPQVAASLVADVDVAELQPARS